MNYCMIGLGGALGAMARHAMGSAVMALTKAPFPYGTLCINVLGSFLIGVCIGMFASVWDPGKGAQLFLVTGFLGGFTTFSTFSLDAVTLAGRGDFSGVATYVLGSVVFSIAAVYAGIFLMGKVAG